MESITKLHNHSTFKLIIEIKLKNSKLEANLDKLSERTLPLNDFKEIRKLFLNHKVSNLIRKYES